MAAAFVLWMIAIGAGMARAQAPSCADLRAQKEKVYGFHLTQLNEAQIDAKSKEIDAYWKQLHDGAVLQIGRFRFRAHFGTRRDQQIQRIVPQESTETDPQAKPVPSSRGSLSEESVMALFERMGELQSQFFEHSQARGWR